MQECRKKPDAIQVYRKASWKKYQAEFQKLTAIANKYQRVKEIIGSDINDVVMPHTDFQTLERCFHINSRLVQLIVKS